MKFLLLVYPFHEGSSGNLAGHKNGVAKEIYAMSHKVTSVIPLVCRVLHIPVIQVKTNNLETRRSISFISWNHGN
jgi:hypothetical protein